MEENEVKYYLDNILKPKLLQLKVSKDYIKKILDNIDIQIHSLLKHWNESKFRETILFLGLEEGTFYKPKDINVKVKCFVVVTIRNSLIETLGSVEYKVAGLKNYISDDDIIDITTSAIKYFDSINLRKLSENLDYSNYDDIYLNIVNKYKLAWKALTELCFCTKLEKSYEKLLDYDKMGLIDLQPRQKFNNSNNSNLYVEHQSGIDPSYSINLISIIKNVIYDNNMMPYFFTDCFKDLSRNIEKLFQVIEILLQHNRVFLTSNYYISNDYVAKRKNILRASHTTEDIFNKLLQLNNLSSKHLDALTKIRIKMLEKD